MSDYKPSSIVVSLCKKLHAIPIAESDRLKTDGVLVIVVADGRKLSFTTDDITRTLTEPDPESPKKAMAATLVGAQDLAPKSSTRKPRVGAKPSARPEETHAE